METDKKEAAAGDNLRIKLALNEPQGEYPCKFCGGLCKPDGFDFVVCDEESHLLSDYVCCECTKERAPELYEIHNAAQLWLKDKTEEAYHEGRAFGEQEGKEYAVELIMRAIEEPLETRIIRVCRTEILESTKLPEDDIPF